MQTIPRRRLIGVLGGMGPAATIDFMAKIVMLTPAARDQEHVPLLVHDVPQIPDRSSAIAAGSDAPFLPMLAGLMQLARGGAEVIAIPCNTAHHWHERLARNCDVPLLHIADAVIEMLAGEKISSGPVALLGTRGTVRSGLYQARWGSDDGTDFAVNLFDPRESDLATRGADQAIQIGNTAVTDVRRSAPARLDWWKPLAVLALGVLLFEWFIYNRRVFI